MRATELAERARFKRLLLVAVREFADSFWWTERDIARLRDARARRDEEYDRRIGTPAYDRTWWEVTDVLIVCEMLHYGGWPWFPLAGEDPAPLLALAAQYPARLAWARDQADLLQ